MYQQQEMPSEDMRHDESRSSYFEGLPPYNDYASSSYAQGQKVVAPEKQGPPFEYRLGLIIVSLILWVIVFFGIIVVAIKFVPPLMIAFIDPLLFIGLIIFSAFAVAANLLFNRTRR